MAKTKARAQGARERSKARVRRGTRAAHLFMMAGLATLGVGIVVFTQSREYSPLGEYPEQTVLSRVEGVSGPAAELGGVVIVQGTKCNRTAHVVPVVGSLSWTRLEPSAMVVGERGPGNGVRPPGCETRVFENAVPADAAPGLWVIRGNETAERNGVRQVKTWTTEPFRLVEPRP